jgi:hypothetical protein
VDVVGWEPVTLWQIRCDGVRGTLFRRCEQVWSYPVEDDTPNREDGPWPVLYRVPTLDRYDRTEARAAEWVLAEDGRALCPAHVAANETMLRDQLDGLPFDNPIGTGRDVGGDSAGRGRS